ncbi:hypothetical protein LguiB_024181 [Lonicera macranthoides]
MASYGYANRGYTTYNDMDPLANDHINPRYGGGYSHSDHVCKPVIIDAEGRKQPIIRYTPNESYVIKRETIVERVHSPMTEYKNYGVPKNDKWRRPSSPIYDRDRPHMMVEHYRYGSPTKYEVNNDNWQRPSSPIYDRPDDVEEFITKVQTEVSQPTRIGPLTGPYKRNPANPTDHIESTGYGDWNKPTVNAIRNERLTEPAMVNSSGWSRPAPLGWTKPAGRPLTGPINDISEPKNFNKEADKSSSFTTSAPQKRYNDNIETIGSNQRLTEPVMGNSGTSWSRPAAPLGWTKPANHPLTGPTNDIGDAVNFLKEAIKSSSITTGAPSHTRYNDGYVETIDSSEAKRRYARPLFKTSSESYNGTINSKDAIDKYGGTFVP